MRLRSPPAQKAHVYNPPQHSCVLPVPFFRAPFLLEPPLQVTSPRHPALLPPNNLIAFSTFFPRLDQYRVQTLPTILCMLTTMLRREDPPPPSIFAFQPLFPPPQTPRVLFSATGAAQSLYSFSFSFTAFSPCSLFRLCATPKHLPPQSTKFMKIFLTTIPSPLPLWLPHPPNLFSLVPATAFPCRRKYPVRGPFLPLQTTRRNLRPSTSTRFFSQSLPYHA